MASKEHCNDRWDELPGLFPRILHLWKEAPTHNNWAIEKLMEIFRKHIAPDLSLVESAGFPKFLEGFFESGQLIQYPDFVMNNVALMAGEVLLLTKSSQLKPGVEETMFRLIRYPLEYWLVDKGHSAHVTLQLYSKFVRHQVMLTTLEKFLFDLPQAMAYVLASPHNYTRKSAGNYITDLISFAFRKTDQDTDMKVKLRAQISECIELFAGRLTQACSAGAGRLGIDNPRFKDSKQEIGGEARVRYCLLVCQSARVCPEWLEVITRRGIFSSVLDLCSQAAGTEHGHGEGLHLACAESIVQLVSRLVIERLDVSTEEKDLLVELSLLPLFVLTSATPQLVQKFSPEVIAKVKCAVASSSSAHPVPMMKQAVGNLYSILSNQIALVSGDHVELLKYFSLQTLTAPPTVLRPLVCRGQLRNNEVVNFLHDSFPHLQDFKDKSSGHVENILTIVQCVMKQPGLTHVNIQVAMDCYVKLAKDARNIDREAVLSLLQILQLKMVDIDPNVQEAAVTAAGDLFLS
ncbi:hypothetical protein ElyMa_000498600, partial [Elysia marginata]